MTKGEIVEILGRHKEAKARRGVLEADVARMERQLEREQAEDAAGSTMQGRGFGGVPGSGRISKAVETAAVRSMDGEPSQMLAMWQAELEAMREELAQLAAITDRVDRAMDALTQMERQVIELHEMEGVSWRELVDRSRRLWGYVISEGTLRNRQRAALEKLAVAMR